MPDVECIVIPDERVAGYFALGMAQQGTAVALVCTSGTAVLNLAPAVCEAYHQGIPLLLLTADRPAELIGMGENQAINQHNIYKNFIKAAYNLSASDIESGSATVANTCKTAIHKLFEGGKGPVHINIQLREPLYESATLKDVGDFETETVKIALPDVAAVKLMPKTLVLVGLMQANAELNALLNRLSVMENVVVVTETTSNMYGGHFISNADAVVASAKQTEADFAPDLVIQLGRQVVSKRLKEFLKRRPAKLHVQVAEFEENWNSLSAIGYQKISADAVSFLQVLLHHNVQEPSGYRQLWLNQSDRAAVMQQQYVESLPFCDMKVFDTLVKSFPAEALIQYGNSSPIRYSNFFKHKAGLQVNANRGTSGIDGCVSTAAGAAHATGKLTVNIVGDVSFFYDSNALWNNYLSPQLRIIIINNSGGNIFRLIDGPGKVPDFEKFFETRHNLSAEKLALMYGIPYYFCQAQKELDEALRTFYSPQNGKPAILEIKTDGELSAKVFKEYWQLFN